MGIGIPDLLLNLLSCHGFLKNNESVVILKYPHRMSEYYFNKGFIIFDCDEVNFKRLPSRVKYRVVAEVAVNSNLVMICYTTIPSTSNTLKNFLVNSNYHSSYTNQEFNTEKEQMSTIFSTYVTPQITEIHHPALLQECKLNLDAAEYEKNMKANIYKPYEKRNLIVLIIKNTGQHQ